MSLNETSRTLKTSEAKINKIDDSIKLVLQLVGVLLWYFFSIIKLSTGIRVLKMILARQIQLVKQNRLSKN